VASVCTESLILALLARRWGTTTYVAAGPDVRHHWWMVAHLTAPTDRLERYRVP